MVEQSQLAVSSSSAGKRSATCTRATTRGLTLYQTRYLSWRCRRTSRKPRSRRGELEKGDSHALFETIVRLTDPQKCITFTKTTATCEMILLARTTVSTSVAPRDAGSARWSQMPDTVTSVAFFFFFLLAYTTSDLRTFRQTCVHVRKECSLEISVPLTTENTENKTKSKICKIAAAGNSREGRWELLVSYLHTNGPQRLGLDKKKHRKIAV